MESETEFLLRRASEEGRRAMNSVQPQAEEAHEEMAIRYTVKAVEALSVDDGDAPAVDGDKSEPS